MFQYSPQMTVGTYASEAVLFKYPCSLTRLFLSFKVRAKRLGRIEELTSTLLQAILINQYELQVTVIDMGGSPVTLDTRSKENWLCPSFYCWCTCKLLDGHCLTMLASSTKESSLSHDDNLLFPTSMPLCSQSTICLVRSLPLRVMGFALTYFHSSRNRFAAPSGTQHLDIDGFKVSIRQMISWRNFSLSRRIFKASWDKI